MSNEVILALLGILVPFLSAVLVGIFKMVTGLNSLDQTLKIVQKDIGHANMPNTILGTLHDHEIIIDQIRDWAIMQGFNRRKD